jgi:hypothetical protein
MLLLLLLLIMIMIMIMLTINASSHCTRPYSPPPPRLQFAVDSDTARSSSLLRVFPDE